MCWINYEVHWCRSVRGANYFRVQISGVEISVGAYLCGVQWVNFLSALFCASGRTFY